MEEVLIGLAFIFCLKKKKKRRSYWMRRTLKAREHYSATKYLEDLGIDGCLNDFLRMNSSEFEFLLNLVGKNIAKQDTNWRKSINYTERFAVTLRFLATGCSYGSLGDVFKISHQLISMIIPEVCEALVEGLQEYLHMPTSAQEWLQVANKFFNLWNFPHCLGSIDGKHVAIQKPIGSGSEYYNYKGFYSVVLLALVDAEYNFLYVNIGCQGRITDGGVFANTLLRKKIIERNLNLPRDCPLPGRTTPVPYVFVTDDAFPLEKHLLKPFLGPQDNNTKERKFNYRTSRARRTVENAFGILSARFRVLRSIILLDPQKTTTLIMACVLLHNFLRKTKSSTIYAPPQYYDKENSDGTHTSGQWRSDTQQLTSLQPVETQTEDGKVIRNEFADYFSHQGLLDWASSYY
ncbi:putative nuclease HARBI1 [Pectinophora gossypiella]|uniref:DDE Tnp4 domain-containing protein n=1 Tax=Pectinophora gossypiella TaxID=13191 RepID=A0A1E1W8G4_PECGO|nr:putative nuclease HARBI1 [Pectinophora gossypiella]